MSKVAAWIGNCAYYDLFKNDVGAGEHCQFDGKLHPRLVAYNWFDEVFSTQP
jgi:hypothetical protein